MTYRPEPTSNPGRALLALARQPGCRVDDKDGKATRVLLDLAGIQLDSLSSFSSAMKNAEEAGLIARRTNGKRTLSIALLEPGLRWCEEQAVPEPVAAVLPPVEADVEGRPGRVAARLERSLPPLVEDAVRAVFAETLQGIAERLGFVAPVEHDPAQLVALEGRIAELEEELKAERRLGHQAREALNLALADTTARRGLDASPLRPHDLPEAWRTLAAEAIGLGWLLRRTNGGHVEWRSPEGRKVYGASTTSDWRSVRNHRSDMQKIGFPKGLREVAG